MSAIPVGYENSVRKDSDSCQILRLLWQDGKPTLDAPDCVSVSLNEGPEGACVIVMTGRDCLTISLKKDQTLAVEHNRLAPPDRPGEKPTTLYAG